MNERQTQHICPLQNRKVLNFYYILIKLYFDFLEINIYNGIMYFISVILFLLFLIFSNTTNIITTFFFIILSCIQLIKLVK